jgi:DNA-binding PadR family transcriptional regulator
MEKSLTELEGAVLSEIHHRGKATAFAVRRAFQVSPSVEWSGSAGAVYPAIKRLTSNGLIRSETQNTARKTSHLSLTPLGIALLDDWVTDIGRAVGVGLDPFRLRSGLWAHLPTERRQTAFLALREALFSQIAEAEAYHATLDAVEQRRTELALILQRARLQWVERELSAQ